MAYGLNREFCDPTLVAQKVIQGVFPGVTTIQLDELAAETAAYMTSIHPDYSTLAARICASNLHKNTRKSFSETISILYHAKHPKTGTSASLISSDVYSWVQENASKLDAVIVYERDFEYDYFGFKTLEKSYLLKVDGKIVERPQHMLMRTAVGIHLNDLEAAIETYDLMSRRVFTHATPTLFNAGTPKPQMSSCFLLTMKEDSIAGIYETLSMCAKISKYAGGIGLAVSDIRAHGSYISGTNGHSNGLVPMLRVFDSTARYVDQGGGKRKGSFAIYLEPWHADIESFLELKKNNGKEEMRARDLFYALWVNDLFMQRVEKDKDWTLFCPKEAPGLTDTYGEAFRVLYEGYEKQGLGRKTIKAKDLFLQILRSQMETGTPYMMYKDACNEKSNQKNLGTIKCSNLCTEIVQFTSPEEAAVCNLASINVHHFVLSDGTYDFDGLRLVAKVITRNLNKVIDANYYPVKEAETSNKRHRPIGLGIQGLADTFIQMRLPFESPKAKQLNRDIFETIYFGACESSAELAVKDGPYSTFEGSPMSKGIFQFDMWNAKPNPVLGWDWETLRTKIQQTGVRNSLLVAPMPTASTSQILGKNEAFEPFTNNIYLRRVLAGEFTVVNRYLVEDLIELGLWGDRMKNKIIGHHGSIQNIQEIPADIKALYKTVWEMKQRTILDMAADRGPFIDQSQSLNLSVEDPTVSKLSTLHFHGWKAGLKTGMYYLRTKAKVNANQFTVTKDDELIVARVMKGGSNTTYTSPSMDSSMSSDSSDSGSMDCLNCSG